MAKKKKAPTPKQSKLATGQVKYKMITCAFCKGKGRDPFGIPSKLSNCQVCWGKGKVAIADIPHETCGACKGTGIFEYHRLPCSVCKGKGVVPKDRRKGPKGMNAGTGLPEIGNY